MRTRRSWRNQDRLWKAIGRELAAAATPPEPAAPPAVRECRHPYCGLKCTARLHRYAKERRI